MLEAALARSRIEDAQVTLVPLANHDYMQAVTGGENENFILSRFVPRHHDDVVEWAAQRFDLPPRQPEDLPAASRQCLDVAAFTCTVAGTTGTAQITSPRPKQQVYSRYEVAVRRPRDAP